ncbi:MAG: hypothetical protein COA45_07965 [Zetaproteobacteria bacterium]|nr:MAG: hypothetical protein COA45_07965 [Zetaproteobacteria bacterium]
MSLFMVQSAKFLALFLIVTFSLSTIGRYHWIFALLSHFKIQYFIGGLLLCGILFPSHYFLSFLMFTIAIISYVQTRLPMTEPWMFTTQPSQRDTPVFKIAQYNKYYKNQHHQRFYNTLKDADLILMQEVARTEIEHIRDQFVHTHPFRLPPELPRANALFILSKYEIQNLEFKKIAPDICTTLGVRFEISPANTTSPIVIYSVHTEAPIGKNAVIHNAELSDMAQWIAQDKAQNIIFMGDWNTTPYAPAFQDLLARTQLNYQNYSYLSQGSWPSFFLLPALTIPIDHILFSNALNLLSIEKGASSGSDHFPIIATIGIK